MRELARCLSWDSPDEDPGVFNTLGEFLAMMAMNEFEARHGVPPTIEWAGIKEQAKLIREERRAAEYEELERTLARVEVAMKEAAKDQRNWSHLCMCKARMATDLKAFKYNWGVDAPFGEGRLDWMKTAPTDETDAK